MKKTLIALALTALPVVSMADVVLYGNIKGGVEVSKYKHVKGTQTNIADYGSYIGFKGSEQLNDSLKAIWQLEQKVDIAGGANTRGFGTRDSFIGLTGGFGTVKAGYQETPVKELNDKLDVWDYDGDAAGLGIFTQDTDASKRAVAITYETPNFSGFSGKAYISPSDNNNNPIGPNGTLQSEDSAIYGLSASYKQNQEGAQGFFGDVAGTYVRNGSVANALGYPKNEGYQALAQFGYEAENWMVGGAYQRGHKVAQLDGVNIKRSNEFALTGTYNIDQALRLKASGVYGWGFKTRNAVANNAKAFGNGKYYQGIIGADYALSKRTVANGQVGYVKIGNSNYDKAYGTLSVGLSHKF